MTPESADVTCHENHQANRCANTSKSKSNDPENTAARGAAHDLSTASAGTSQAPSAAVDKSAPSTPENRFAPARFRLIADD
jgi:hypothetical protein